MTNTVVSIFSIFDHYLFQYIILNNEYVMSIRVSTTTRIKTLVYYKFIILNFQHDFFKEDF